MCEKITFPWPHSYNIIEVDIGPVNSKISDGRPPTLESATGAGQFPAFVPRKATKDPVSATYPPEKVARYTISDSLKNFANSPHDREMKID